LVHFVVNQSVSSCQYVLDKSALFRFEPFLILWKKNCTSGIFIYIKNWFS